MKPFSVWSPYPLSYHFMILEQVLTKRMSRDAWVLAQRCWGMNGSKGKALSANSNDFFQKRKDVWGNRNDSLKQHSGWGWGNSLLWWFFCTLQWVVKPAMGSGPTPKICCASLCSTSHHRELPLHSSPAIHSWLCVYIHKYIQCTYLYPTAIYRVCTLCVRVFICNWSGTDPSITEPRPQHLPDFSQVVYRGGLALPCSLLAQLLQEVRCS